ncbi:hypothetical protein T484DRAFT_1950070, partial [Baffinella frigidus]
MSAIGQAPALTRGVRYCCKRALPSPAVFVRRPDSCMFVPTNHPKSNWYVPPATRSEPDPTPESWKGSPKVNSPEGPRGDCLLL